MKKLLIDVVNRTYSFIHQLFDEETGGELLLRLGARELALRRKGPGAAEAVTMRPGSLTVTRPNAIWQIDHSPADIILVDADSRAPIGRPWVTLVIDVASRVITGLYVSLDPPSVVSVGMALQHAILAKDAALAERGISAEWPAFGLPELVHSDNGSDFRSQSFARACSNLGIETDHRPVGAPRYGGHVERLIGSVMSEMHLLPGATFSNVAARGDYDSDAAAVMTIDEFEIWLWRFVAGDYNRRVHNSLSAPAVGDLAAPLHRTGRRTAPTPRPRGPVDRLPAADLAHHHPPGDQLPPRPLLRTLPGAAVRQRPSPRRTRL